MLFRSHLSIGLFVFAALITRTISFWPLGTLNSPTVIATVFYLFGLILPGIDSPHSKISRHSPFFHYFASLFTKHRGFVHSIFSGFILMVGIGFILSFLNLNLANAGWFFVGYLVHLLTDGLTPHGVKLFFPISNATIRGPISSGSFSEKVVSVLSYSAALILIVQSLGNII